MNADRKDKKKLWKNKNEREDIKLLCKNLIFLCMSYCTQFKY